MWLLSCLSVVEPHQRAIVLRLGAPHRVAEPGLVLKMPWPIDRLYIPEDFARDARGRLQVRSLTVTGVRELVLGTTTPANKDSILWTNDHVGEEVYQFVRSGEKIDPTGAANVQGDFGDVAMVSVEMPLQYAITDVQIFDELSIPERRDDLLRAVAQREIFKEFQNISLEQVLAGGRRDVSERLQLRIQKAFDALNPGPDGKPRGAGVRLIFVGVVGVHPPKESAKSFELIVQTDQRREATIEAARADEVRTLVQVAGNVSLAREIIAELDRLQELNESKSDAVTLAKQEDKIRQLIEGAGGFASSLLADASAARWEKHMGDRGRASRYEGQLALNQASPMVYRAGLYFDALRQAVSGSRLYVTHDAVRVDVDLQEKTSGLEVFDPGRPE